VYPLADLDRNLVAGLVRPAENADGDDADLALIAGQTAANLETTFISLFDGGDALLVSDFETMLLDGLVEVGESLILAQVGNAQHATADSWLALVVGLDALHLGIELTDGPGVGFTLLEDEKLVGGDAGNAGLRSHRQACGTGSDDDEVIHRIRG